MQLQMEVCNLNECDFLNRFKEYDTKEDYEKIIIKTIINTLQRE